MVSFTHPLESARSAGHSWTHCRNNDESLPDDVARVPIVMVNVCLVGSMDAGWVLVDAGLAFSATRIVNAARERFGEQPPKAIVLTHGHFDHVGALRSLMERWPEVPVYVHELELPYLTGQSSYPPPDPTVGGGLMSRLSPTYPKGPYDFGDRLRALPADGTVPGLPEWKWIPTPGHSPGHVSFFRDRDRTLIAGDAFVTQRQESLVGVMTEHKEMRGPPRYFTQDWQQAWQSVERLAALRPRVAVTGHGKPMVNPRLDHDLNQLARDFEHEAIPSSGRYVDRPAVTDKRGVISLPPKPFDRTGVLMLAIAGVFVAGVVVYAFDKRVRQPDRDEEAIAPPPEPVAPPPSPFARYAGGAWTAFKLARRLHVV